jgi:alpha-beta hydrolase superfamily lysophospholipase
LALLVVAVVAAVTYEASTDAAPGEVVDDDEVDLGGDGGVRAWRIRYGSTDVQGEPSEVGALVALPAGVPPAGGWPVVAYAHGTTGGADDCAPSEVPELAGVGDEVRALAAAGYVAVATDYEGIGTDGPHPYLNGASEARAVVDSVRAARAFVGADRASTRWAVLGHSQGGHAALFAAEQGPSMAPELELVGAVAQAPVTDVGSLTAPDAPLGSTFLALSVVGFLATDAGQAFDEDDLLTGAGRDAVDAVDDACDVPLVEDRLLRDGPAADALDDYEAAQVPGQVAAAAPVLVQQGTADPLVVPEATGAYLGRACAAGTVVAVEEYRGADHLEVVAEGGEDALAWIAGRFADEPVRSSCGAPA